MSWDVRFFTWTDSADPRKNTVAFEELLKGPPITTQQTPRLDYMWYAPTVPSVPRAKVAVVATSTVSLGAGAYTLRTISDDAIRVWVDGKLAIDHWEPHESAVDVSALTGGKHELKVEYYQVDGWTELRVEILKGQQKAGGSPGPH